MPTSKPASMTLSFSEFFEQHYLPLKLAEKRPATVVQYRNTIKMFSRHLGCQARFEDFTRYSWSSWKTQMIEDDISRATMNKHRRHLLALVNWARYWSMTNSDLTSKDIGKVDEMLGDPIAWTVEEIGRLLDAAKLTSGWIGKMRSSDFWVAVILAIYDTGARKGVLLSISPAELLPDTPAIRLPAVMQKQKVTQFCKITAQTLAAIQRIYDPHAPYLFHWPHDRYRNSNWNYLNQKFREIVLRAGLDVDHGLFHRIRRTSASYKHKYSPGSATYELGHSSPTVTRRYLDPRIIGGTTVVDLMPRPSFCY